MKKRTLALLLCLVLTAALASGCSSSRTDYKIAMVTDSGAISDNHLNQAVWEGLELIEEEYRADINFYRPSSATTDEYMTGISTLVKNGYNIIVLPGSLFSETLQKAAAQYPDCFFIGIDCEIETVPPNAVLAVFDKSQAGFLAGIAAAIELDGLRFGGVFGSASASEQELISGFFQGVKYAQDNYGSTAQADGEDMILLSSQTDYPLGQQQAATLFQNGVQCLLVSSDPTGLGALAEVRMRALMGDTAWVVGSDADMYITATYDPENELSAAVTSAMCDYGQAFYQTAKALIDGDTSFLGKTKVFDSASGGVGLPEENPNLSQKAIDACQDAGLLMTKGDIVIAALTLK